MNGQQIAAARVWLVEVATGLYTSDDRDMAETAHAVLMGLLDERDLSRKVETQLRAELLEVRRQRERDAVELARVRAARDEALRTVDRQEAHALEDTRRRAYAATRAVS